MAVTKATKATKAKGKTAVKAKAAPKPTAKKKATPTAAAQPTVVSAAPRGVRHWLMKSEPDVFGIAHLLKKQTSAWDGVRNFLARNFMREMALGDRVLFYHSNAKPSGVAGLAEVCALAHPDHTQFDPRSEYFDATATPEKPRWDMVDVRYVATFSRLVPLDELRQVPELAGMMLLTHSRLSVSPVTPEAFALIVRLGASPA